MTIFSSVLQSRLSTARSLSARLATPVVRCVFATVMLAAFTETHAATESLTLTVHVYKVSSGGGDIRLALYDQSAYSGHDGTPIAARVVPAVFPETDVVVTELPPGTYAIKEFQDENRNGTFDKNSIGLPVERFGFSNDASPLLEQASFDRTKFELWQTAQTVNIHLR